MDTATSPLRILLVDDSDADIALNLRALRDMAQEVLSKAVCAGPDLRQALEEFSPDVILSDFSMPGFSGAEALDIARELAPEVPFIYVSGTIGEELAIDVMQRGASDYVLKDNLRRLQPAIERALRASEQQRQHRETQLALRDSEERFRAIVESTEDWIWECDPLGKLHYSNSSVFSLLGLSAAEIMGRNALEFMIPEDRLKAEVLLPRVRELKRGWQGQVLRWQHVDGSVRVLESTAHPLLGPDGNLLGFRGIDRDVTLRVQQAWKIEKLGRIHSMLAAHGNAVVRASDAGELLDSACRAAVQSGLFMAAAIGQPLPGGMLGPTSSAGDPAVLALLAKLGEASLEEAGAGERISVRVFREGRKVVTPDYAQSDAPAFLRRAMAGVGVKGQVALPIGTPPWAVLGLFSSDKHDFDDEEIALLERLTAEIDYARDFISKSERLEYLAFHNPVTGLPNRVSFKEWLGPRLEQREHMMVMADIHRFRYYNGSRSRRFGDQLLRAVALRLKGLMPEGSMLCHPGDDAFLFACPIDHDVPAGTARMASLLDQCCEQPLLVEGEEIRLRLNAGVLLAPVQGSDAEEIERSLIAVLAEAQKLDLPMLAFTEAVRSKAAMRATLERDLRSALELHQFELFLQPKFNAATHRLVGAEALLRWRHPERGMVSPGEFIPVLEETGMVVEVGAWVRLRGLEIWNQWEQQGYVGLRLAVNVSARELRHTGFVEQCTALLDPYEGEHGLDIEITESMLMDDIGKSIQVLQELRSLGCKIAIDDFGTGYSSLNYLSRLPADVLKIDQSFTSALTVSPDTLSLVTNIIGLAHSLGMAVVAEGVEEEEQAKWLRLLRCDQLQGYHLGRPMPVDEFEQKFLS